MKSNRIFALLLAAALVLCACALPAAQAQGAVEALFINVGKADAILLRLGEQRFLVDTGTGKSFDALKQALDLYQVTHLDGVIITHLDKDHVGGLKKLMKSDISVAALYAGTHFCEVPPEEHQVERASKDYDVPLTWLSAGDKIEAEGGAFYVLGPLRRDDTNENNNSLVIDLQTPEGNILLAGDMELEEESELLDQNLIPPATVLKVAHHGEDDATSKRFVLAVKPQWAVISTSTAEEADTPDSKIISRLWDVKCSVAVTQNAEVGILLTLEGGKASAQQIDLR